MVIRISTHVGSFASLCSLLFLFRPTTAPWTVFQGMWLGLAILLLLGAVAHEVRESRASGRLSLGTDAEIRDYMFKWISRGGRVAIFSRDMSWVRDEEMMELLREKARRDELTICLPGEIFLADELRRCGARVCLYPQLRYTPQSRFTIINKDRMDSKVAVGRRIKDKHVIEEFSLGEHPVFSVANDLVEVVIGFNGLTTGVQGWGRAR